LRLGKFLFLLKVGSNTENKMVVTCSMAAEMMLLVLAAFSSLLATSAAWMRSVNEKGNVMFGELE
jgi:hypothetical protein